MDVLHLILAVIAGIAAGFVNTLAGSGSFLTLPALVLLGLPTDVANGTNRIGILLAAIVGFATLKRGAAAAPRSPAFLAWIIVPACAGAITGAQVAVELDAELLDRIVGGLMLLMLGLLLLRPERWLVPPDEPVRDPRRPLAIVLLFLIGAYGGFIQAGVGVFLLAAFVLDLRFGLREANALKLLVVLLFTVPATVVFLIHDKIDWEYGLLLAAGQVAGAYGAARLATRSIHADRWIRALLILVLAGTALRLLT